MMLDSTSLPLWESYLAQIRLDEEEIRQRNRELAKKLYSAEIERDSKERQLNPQIYQVKQQIMSEFWKHTRTRFGQDVLLIRSKTYTEQGFWRANHLLETRRFKVLVDSHNLDQKLKETLNKDRKFPKTPDVTPIQEAHSDFDRMDYFAKTSSTIQMLRQEKERKELLGPEASNNFDSTFKNSPASFFPKKNLAAPGATELKYVTKKETAERYLKKTQLYEAHPHLEATHYSLYHPQSSPNQQTIPVPEELEHETDQEQKFVSDFDPRYSVEGNPIRVSVKPQQSSKFFNLSNQFSISRGTEDLLNQFGVSKTQFLSQTTNVANDPVFEEKNFVKRNLDDYDQYRAEEVPRVNIFKEMANHRDLPKDISDSMLERLNEKFEDIYSKTQTRYQPSFYGSQNQTASGARAYWEIPYVADETLHNSHVITTLMSPHTKALQEVHKKGNSPQKVKPNEPGTDRSSPDTLSRTRTPRVNNKQTLEKKNVPPCRLFEHFEKEYYLKRESSNNEPQEYTFKQTGSPIISNSPTRLYNQEKFVSKEETEEFILNLVNHLNKTNGKLPADHVMRLSEILTLSSPSKLSNSKQVNSKIAEIWKGSPTKNRVASATKASLETTTQTKRIDEYNFSLNYLENLAGTMTAKYLENLRSNLNIGSIKFGCLSLMALLGSFDKTVPLVNNRVSTTDVAVHTYFSQPGRLTPFLKRIGPYLTQNHISQALLEEYLHYFEEFKNALALEGVDQDAGECVDFFRFLHALRRFVEVGINSQTIKTKIEKWSPEVNQKLNEELVQRLRNRQGNDSDKPTKMELVAGEHNLGIDFKAWDQHLRQMEQENLARKKLQRLQKIKIENAEKQELASERKRQEDQILQDNYEELAKKQKYDMEVKEQQRQFDHEHMVDAALWKKYYKGFQHQLDKEWQIDAASSYYHDREHNEKLSSAKKEQQRVEIQDRHEKRIENREHNNFNKQDEIQKLKEHRVWNKAQQYLERQQNIFKERDLLDHNQKINDRVLGQL